VPWWWRWTAAIETVPHVQAELRQETRPRLQEPTMQHGREIAVETVVAVNRLPVRRPSARAGMLE
jgi:hypothetical protein